MPIARPPASEPRVRRSRPRRLVRVLLSAVGATLLALLAFLQWLAIGDDADQDALETALATYDVTVRQEEDETVTVGPCTPHPGAPGVVFLPGTRIEPAVYVATWAPFVASTGVTVHIPGVPLNLLVLAGDRFTEMMSRDPARTWVVAGHFMGGFEAAGYAAAGADRPDALLLWGSGPGRSDLRGVTIPTLLVSGGADTVLPLDFALREGSLPLGSTIEVVPGMSHSQFCRYSQTEDPADPDRRSDTDALADLVSATTRFLVDVTSAGGS